MENFNWIITSECLPEDGDRVVGWWSKGLGGSVARYNTTQCPQLQEVIVSISTFENQSFIYWNEPHDEDDYGAPDYWISWSDFHDAVALTIPKSALDTKMMAALKPSMSQARLSVEALRAELIANGGRGSTTDS